MPYVKQDVCLCLFVRLSISVHVPRCICLQNVSTYALSTYEVSTDVAYGYVVRTCVVNKK